MLRASGKTASATLVHQNQLFIIIKVIILLDYVYIVHLMYSCLHICISIDFGNKYLSIYLSAVPDGVSIPTHIHVLWHSHWSSQGAPGEERTHIRTSMFSNAKHS